MDSGRPSDEDLRDLLSLGSVVRWGENIGFQGCQFAEETDRWRYDELCVKRSISWLWDDGQEWTWANHPDSGDELVSHGGWMVSDHQMVTKADLMTRCVWEGWFQMAVLTWLG